MVDYYSITSENGNFINQAVSFANSGRYSLAFIALDISNFKYINDFYSMDEGDKVIEEIASFFFKNEPLCLAAYSIGFDQFRGIYNVTGLSREELLSHLTKRSQEFENNLYKRYPLVYNHVYIGIYFYEDTSVDVRIAMDRSNLAKKAIKGNFNTNCQIFEDKNCIEHLENMNMTNLFFHSVQTDSLEYYLQPKVSVSKNCVVGAEALVRMRDAEGNLIMPGRFVPVLEQIGLINKLDKIMLEKTFAFQRNCIDDGKQAYPISVNVSKQEFTNTQFIENIYHLQNKYQIDPSLVQFELVESTFVNNILGVVDTINRLRKKGFQINVDDFGSGYSSLNQIANIPADIIKLDGVFARESLKTEKGRAVIKSLITMLNDINYGIVFEGIESREQVDLVSSYGCDTIQGFYYGYPIAAREFVSKYGCNAAVLQQPLP